MQPRWNIEQLTTSLLVALILQLILLLLSKKAIQADKINDNPLNSYTILLD